MHINAIAHRRALRRLRGKLRTPSQTPTRHTIQSFSRSFRGMYSSVMKLMLFVSKASTSILKPFESSLSISRGGELTRLFSAATGGQ